MVRRLQRPRGMRAACLPLGFVLAACSMGLPDTVAEYQQKQGQGALTSPMAGDGATGSACKPEHRPLPQQRPIAVRARRGACDKATLDTAVACLMLENEKMTKKCVDLFQSPDQSCLSCLRSKSTDAELGPLVEDTFGTYPNTPGCIAHHDGTPSGCATTLVASWNCMIGSCSTCALELVDSCMESGAAGACDAEAEAANCVDRYPNCPDSDDLASAIKIAEVFCLAAPR